MQDRVWCTWAMLGISAHQTKVRAPGGEPAPETDATGTHFQLSTAEEWRAKGFEYESGGRGSLCSPTGVLPF